MVSWQKIKESIDWGRRIDFLVNLFVGATGVSLARALFHAFSQLPAIWVWPICWGIGALAAYGFSWLPLPDRGQTKSVGATAPEATPAPLPWAGFASVEAWQADQAERSRLMDLGNVADDLLTPLQIRIMGFRRDLLEFVSLCGPVPEPPTGKDRIATLDWSRKFVAEIVDWGAAYSAGLQKMNVGYRQRFATRVLTIMEAVMQEKPGINVDALEPYTHGLGNPDDLLELNDALQDIVWKLDKAPPLHPVKMRFKFRQLEREMKADEMLAATRLSPAFKKLLDESPPS